MSPRRLGRIADGESRISPSQARSSRTEVTRSPDARDGSNAWSAFLFRHAAAGSLAGWTSLAVLLWSDIGGIGKLVMQSELLPWPLVMLAVAFGSLFAILALAAAFLMLGDENDSASRRSRH